MDDQWFISTDEVKIAAIRRDYLQKIHKIKDPNGKKEFPKQKDIKK
ncbi:TPA: hypothetical protein J0U24_002511 [Enterococcus faecium]|nr:hypothetical protein [Enterococcus faecium]